MIRAAMIVCVATAAFSFQTDTAFARGPRHQQQPQFGQPGQQPGRGAAIAAGILQGIAQGISAGQGQQGFHPQQPQYPPHYPQYHPPHYPQWQQPHYPPHNVWHPPHYPHGRPPYRP